MSNKIKIIQDKQFPQMDIGSPSPVILTDENESLFLAYCETMESKISIIKFTDVAFFNLGWPNDEVLIAHSLYKFGLKAYEFNLVENSPLFAKLKKQNSIHPNHSDLHWSDYFHLIVCFHDETLEVVAKSYKQVAESSNEKALFLKKLIS